ncbi:hypothetical protein SAMN05216573_10784 [Bradyrhizobium sp. Rc3b]|uniref:hypothetical protein n=1 Tax=Bradyrhizobium sp. Rc3b TaxID=1855322 RepID=UPI0008E2929C|nr:hypothetical protein [Bradyrhizobium sp. Rc3b]SFN02706.1 hypothetical protein SAMN05216573_10784 [Bradyrhizobium sp. Rc3b]
MIRLILLVSVALDLAAGTVQAQQGMSRKGFVRSLDSCKQLAAERGFSSAGGIMKGQGRAKREFVISCMRGKQT